MEKDYTRYDGCASAVAVIIALVVLALVCFSCKTKYITQTEYNEVPVVMHDTIAKNIWRIDTTIVKDSVYFAVNGDTIVRERYNTIERIKVAHDTIMRFVEKPVEVVSTKEVCKQVEVNRIYWWQKLLMWMGGIGVVVIGIMVNKKVNKKMS